MKVQIVLNGEPTVVSSRTVWELIESLELSTRKIAIERNSQIVPRSEYASTPLAAGDVVEIVALIGGG